MIDALTLSDMSDSTKTSTDPTQKPLMPRVLSAEEIYDMLMAEIEPDLVSGVIEHLAEKYPNETPEEKAARAARYTQAFAEYDVRLQQYREEWDAKLARFKRLAIGYLEHKDRGSESARLQDLESSLAA
jgi:hypothetical protein